MAVNEYIENIIKSTNIPFAYRQFLPYKYKPVPEPPYIVYFINRETASGADNKSLLIKKHIIIEFYSITKDTNSESIIENAIYEFHFEKNEDYIDSEQLYLVTYEFDLIEKRRS